VLFADTGSCVLEDTVAVLTMLAVVPALTRVAIVIVRVTPEASDA
jgi:hypothetical protein